MRVGVLRFFAWRDRKILLEDIFPSLGACRFGAPNRPSTWQNKSSRIQKRAPLDFLSARSRRSGSRRSRGCSRCPCRRTDPRDAEGSGCRKTSCTARSGRRRRRGEPGTLVAPDMSQVDWDFRAPASRAARRRRPSCSRGSRSGPLRCAGPARGRACGHCPASPRDGWGFRCAGWSRTAGARSR